LVKETSHVPSSASTVAGSAARRVAWRGFARSAETLCCCQPTALVERLVLFSCFLEAKSPFVDVGSDRMVGACSLRAAGCLGLPEETAGRILFVAPCLSLLSGHWARREVRARNFPAPPVAARSAGCAASGPVRAGSRPSTLLAVLNHPRPRKSCRPLRTTRTTAAPASMLRPPVRRTACLRRRLCHCSAPREGVGFTPERNDRYRQGALLWLPRPCGDGLSTLFRTHPADWNLPRRILLPMAVR